MVRWRIVGSRKRKPLLLENIARFLFPDSVRKMLLARAIPLIFASYFGTLAYAAVVSPMTYDWRYRVISNLSLAAEQPGISLDSVVRHSHSRSAYVRFYKLHSCPFALCISTWCKYRDHRVCKRHHFVHSRRPNRAPAFPLKQRVPETSRNAWTSCCAWPRRGHGHFLFVCSERIFVPRTWKETFQTRAAGLVDPCHDGSTGWRSLKRMLVSVSECSFSLVTRPSPGT